MAGNPADCVAYVRDQLGGMRNLTCGRFFGGTAFWADGVQFAMIMRNTLCFAIDDDSRRRYERAGCGCFSYSTKKGVVQVRRYWQVPEAVLEDAESLQAWARDAVTAARRGRAPA